MKENGNRKGRIIANGRRRMRKKGIKRGIIPSRREMRRRKRKELIDGKHSKERNRRK